MRIVQVSLSELGKLQEISRSTFEHTFSDFNTAEDMRDYLVRNLSLDQLKFELESAVSSFYFIYVEEELAGYMKLNVSDSFEIERIYILEKFKGIGAGKAFMNFAFMQAKSLGFKSVWLGVWEHNTKAISFYTSLGFTSYGEHNFLLGSDLQRDILMRLELN